MNGEIKLVLTPSKKLMRLPRGTDFICEEISPLLRTEPKIRTEMFVGYDLKWRKMLADAGLIPYKTCRSGQLVCVWCDLVVEEFHTEEKLAHYLEYHEEWGCNKPEQEDTDENDATLLGMRETNASDMEEVDRTTREKLKIVHMLRSLRNKITDDSVDESL